MRLRYLFLVTASKGGAAMYKTFFDELLGYDFTIYVREHPNGFTFETEIEKDGVRVLPTVKPDDQLWSSIDDARQAARLHAWSLIYSLVDKAE